MSGSVARKSTSMETSDEENSSPAVGQAKKTSYQIHVRGYWEKLEKDPKSRRESRYMLAAAMLVGLNTGFVNGVW